MDITKFTTGLRFFNAKNVAEGGMTIDKAEEMEINAKPTLVLTFKNDPKGLALKPEQVSALATALGSTNTDDWAGKTIRLGKGPKNRGVVIDV